MIRPGCLAPLLIAAATLALARAPAAAQPDAAPAIDASPGQIAQAKQLYDDATASYTSGRFDEALAGYQAAYELYPAPQFLFNIAQCHLQLGQWERAEFFFAGYLREVPAASNRPLVEDLMREARERRAAEAAAAARKLDLEKIRLETERIEQERQAKEREARLLADQAAAERRDRPAYERWWFWAIVGGAAVAVTTTAVIATSSTTTVLPEGSLGTWDRR